MSENSLIIFTKAAEMLAQADTIQKTKELKNLALTAADWAKRKGLGEEAVQYARGYALEAMRRMGEMLKEKPPARGAGPGRGKQGYPQLPCLLNVPPLKELGISKRESSDAQLLAEIKKEEFKDLKNGKTTIKKIRQKKRKEKTIQKEKEALENIDAKEKKWTITKDQNLIKCDVLITDPPYGILDEEWEPKNLEKFTREWLVRWNCCDADFMFIFFSQQYLFESKKWFDESLSKYEFKQLLVWHYPNNKKPQSRMGFKQTWEPIFFYRKKNSKKQIRNNSAEWSDGQNDFDCHAAAIPQSNFNGSECKQHPAQKPVSILKWLINASTQIGETICDPFAGSGTTGIAAMQLHRKFYGIEINDDFVKIAEQRISSYGI